ncbi:MAG: HipA N-terminal domain-containing protein, partial [Rhizobiaceae bacterium]|nr:HipA N-terminal domain-containing protein [Rhizobiaceae bacterium]
MTTIFYETLPVAHLRMTDELRLDYDPSWVKKPAAFPISLSMPFRDQGFGPSIVLPWLANLLPETHLSEIGQMLKVS